MRKISLLLSCAVAMLLCVGVCNAQVLYGSLTGNVTDPSSAAIPAAKVQAVNNETGVTRQAETDARGSYLFSNLPFGSYKVTVDAKGFKTSIVDKVQVNVNEVRRVDIAAQIAQATESVEVAANSAVLQTDKSDVHSEISAQQVVELPYNGGEGKNFQSLLYLVPGAGIPATREANSEAGNPQRAQTIFMNGVSSTGNSTKLDGATVSYPWLPVNIAYVPPSEAIETVSITTNSFDAEQGAAGGAAVNVAIKSGTNSLHGVLFERNQNNDMTAVNYFSHTSPLNKNVFNQYGFAVGGPVWIPKLFNGKNKLFFFADYQGTKRRQYAATTNKTLPTSAMRSGDFSATGVTIYDPLTGNADGTGRTPFANNTIPTGRIDPASVTLTSLLPALTRPSALTSNYDAYGNTQYNRSNWDFKVNYNPTEKTMVWGRYSISPMDIVALLDLGPAGGDAFGGGNPGHAGGRVQTTAAGFTYAVSPTMVVDGNVGYTRQNIGANGDPQDGLYGLDVLKIPGTNGVGPNYFGIPGFQVTGVANIGNTSTGSPFQFRDNQYTTGINLSKTKGAHNLRFGFEYDKYALNHFQPQGGTFGTARGTFGFDGTLTALKGGAAVNFNGVPANSWAEFLLGFPSRIGKITQFQNPNALRFSDWAFYARDQWQVSRNLTVNYGMRWEYYPIFSHDHYGATRYDPSTYTVLIGGQGGVPWDTGASASKKGFAPRVGLAYRLGSKTVIRSGYGITIDPDNMRNQRNAFPSVVNQDFTPANSYMFVTTPGVAQASLRTGIPAATAPDLSTGKFTPSTVASTTTYLPSTNIAASFPKFMNRGYIQSWNFFIQREFAPTLTAEAGYVGTHAVHQMMGVNINGSAPNTGNAGRQLAPYLTTDLNVYEPFGNLTYHGLQSTVKKRFGSSIVGVAYTFSKAINNYNGDNGDGTIFRAYPVSYTLNKQLAGFDRTHTFQLYHVYQLPFGKGQKFLNHGVIGYIVGGFQIGGTLSRFSGLPFTLGSSSSVNAGGQGQTASQINPVVQILGGHDPNTPYFDGTAFTNPPAGTLGSTGRNLLRGPGFFNVDENVSRIFSFKDGKVKLQLVGEAFNLTNTPSFSTPNATFAAPTLNSDGTVKSYGNYSVISGTVSTARQLQVGAYVRF
uniref:Cna B domain protein n=1 Tax=Solibacter usitatus (strain Ellin6076) TaxID=234267 RepID=Q024C2_SOLUE